jgi:hypothetical protein
MLYREQSSFPSITDAREPDTAKKRTCNLVKSLPRAPCSHLGLTYAPTFPARE